jgi:DNA-binding NtrC family response regulator
MLLRRVIVVSAQPEVQQLARRIGQQTFIADDAAEAIGFAKTLAPELLLFDDRFTPAHLADVIATADKNGIKTPVVAICRDTDNGRINEYKQVGAFDCLHTLADQEQLLDVATRIKNRLQPLTNSPAEYFISDLAESAGIVGKSKAIANTLRITKLVADSNCNPVLITGETGTGKELAAKAVHILRHSNEQFVAINCAALTATLLESELFGHVKGAFTGADRDKTGLLELAGQGTIFLDEISEMPPELQAKLLRVLQEKTFRKVGGIKDIFCQATIIASSNRNLRKEVHASRFRQDLYYRLNICPITIAPLRAPERKEDIRLLAEYFLRSSTFCPEKAGKMTSITALSLETLENHTWPGNVRELRNVIERAILLETTDKIGLGSIIIEHFESTEASDSETSIQIRDFSLEKAERELIARALQETGWQKTHAASLLGITRATLYAKVKQHNIQMGLYLPRETQTEQQDASVPEPITAA